MGKDKWVNPATGEVADGFFTIRGAKYPKGVEFMTMFTAGLKYLASLHLAPNTNRVLFALLADLNFENWTSISQETIAQDLGMLQPHVATAIRDLVKAGIIDVEKDPNDKRRNAYRLNTRLVWRGNAKQWNAEQNRRAGRDRSNVIAMPGVKLPEGSQAAAKQKLEAAMQEAAADPAWMAKFEAHQADWQETLGEAGKQPQDGGKAAELSEQARLEQMGQARLF